MSNFSSTSTKLEEGKKMVPTEVFLRIGTSPADKKLHLLLISRHSGAKTSVHFLQNLSILNNHFFFEVCVEVICLKMVLQTNAGPIYLA